MAEIISVADDVYQELTHRKGKESYSVVIRRLLVGKKNKEKILSFFGKGGVDAAKIKGLSGEWKKWSEEYA